MLPHDLVGDAGEELEVARRHLHVGARLAQRLAVVAALERRELLGAIAQRLRDAQHDAAALGRQRCRPRPSTRAPPARTCTARSTSAVVALATVAKRSPVDGSKTSNVPPSDALTRSPLMISCSVHAVLSRSPRQPDRHSLPRIARNVRRVVRSIDSRLDQARPGDRERLIDGGARARPRSRAANAVTPRPSASAGQSIAPSATPAGVQAPRLLLDLDQAQRRVAEHDRDDAEPLARRRQQLAQRTSAGRRRRSARRPVALAIQQRRADRRRQRESHRRQPVRDQHAVRLADRPQHRRRRTCARRRRR